MNQKQFNSLVKWIARWERLNTKRASLHEKNREILEWAEKELIGPGMDQAAKDGQLRELLAAVRKRKKDTVKARQVRAAYNSLRRKGDPLMFRNWMRELEEMRSPLAEKVIADTPLPQELKEMRSPLAKKGGDHYRHARTVRRIIKNELLPISKGKPGRPKKITVSVSSDTIQI
jgi:hypothetical protein